MKNYKLTLIGTIYFLLNSTQLNAQLDNLGKFRRSIEDSTIVLKIKNKLYRTDYERFYLKDNLIYKVETNDLTYMMIFDKRYLFVGHFENTTKTRMSSIGFTIRPLISLEVIDLENTQLIWKYTINNATVLDDIRSFNPNDGTLIYYSRMKPD